jgi:hypothetical protein
MFCAFLIFPMYTACPFFVIWALQKISEVSSIRSVFPAFWSSGHPTLRNISFLIALTTFHQLQRLYSVKWQAECGLLTKKYVEGSGHILLYRTMLWFSWICRGNLKLRYPSSKPRTVERTSLIKKNSVALVRKRSIPTERPPLVSEVSANLCGKRVLRGQRNEFPRPLISVF